MFFYEPNGTDKQKRFLFFYLPLEIIVIPVATKKTSNFEVQKAEYYFSYQAKN